jgi:hypothetical protein
MSPFLRSFTGNKRASSHFRAVNRILKISLLLFFMVMASGSLQAQAPQFSHTPGFYTEAIELGIGCPESHPEAWVSFDGTPPGPGNAASELVESPLLLESREGEPNGVSMIPQNAATPEDSDPEWIPPQGEVHKAHAIMAACYNEAGAFTEMTGGTFFIDPAGASRYSLPVVSLIFEPEGLFDFETGMMVPGLFHEEGDFRTGNYFQRGQEWERLNHVEFFEADGRRGFGHFSGARIHGNFSRAYSRKSLRMSSRSEYGTSRFEYRLFPNQPVQRYNRFILRQSGQDYNHTLLRDAVVHQIYSNQDSDTQDYRPVIKFINGEYWGVYNIRERYDRHYFELNYDIDRENLDYIDFYFNASPDVSDGDEVHYESMMAYLRENDMSEPEHYSYMQTQMVMDNFIDYLVLGVYMSNTDWPRTNVRMFRSRNEFDPAAEIAQQDGRWRWLINDFDYGLRRYHSSDHNQLQRLFQEGWETELFRGLIENEDFRNAFINRFADHIHTVFSPEHAWPIIDSAAAAIAPEIEEHVQRWSYPDGDLGSWENRITRIKDFFPERPQFMRGQLVEQFGLSGTAAFTLDVNLPDAGYIKLNNILLAEGTDGLSGQIYPFEAEYFSGVPVRVEAVPNAGYSFAGWEGVEADGPVITIDPAELSTITAVFEEAPFSGDEMHPDPHVLSEASYLFSEWSPEEPEGSYPANMVFQQTRIDDPVLSTEMTEPYFLEADEYHPDDAGQIGFPYNLTRRTRINALETEGISFINTGRGRDLGAALLAVDTRGTEQIYADFTAGTLTPNSRVYAIRMQYRVGTVEPFKDVTDAEGRPVEYLRSETPGDTQHFRDIALPAEVVGHPYVQLRWKYYHVSGDDGPRAELRLDDVQVYSEQFTSIADQPEEQPQRWKLHQNYPNPFNPATSIRFELPEQADVRLEVFNVAGQRVALLTDGPRTAGRHTIRFNASSLSSGLYFYRLSSPNGITLSRKMMLVK